MNEKHIELIQANITRMGQNSFQIKGWLITITAALLALFAASTSENSTGNVCYIFIAIIPAFVFWCLDSFYLQQERKFIGIYNDVTKLSDEAIRIDVKPYEMPLEKYKGGRYCIICATFSSTVWPLYFPTIIGLAIAGCLLK